MSYTFRPLALDARELDRLTALFGRVWPANKRLSREYVEWLYRANPAGPALGFNAYSGEEISGHYAVIPFRARLRGETLSAALSLNTAVDANHRGQGLFKTLAERTYRAAATQGIDHIVGIANANSTPGFVRSLGFQLVSALDARLIWGKPNLSTASPEWAQAWTAESLAWRLQQPRAHYWYENANGACHVLGQTKYPGLYGTLKIETDEALRTVIQKEIRAQRTLRPTLWFGKSPALRLPVSLSFPAWLRPSPFNMIFRDLTARGRTLKPESLHFEAADFDVM